MLSRSNRNPHLPPWLQDVPLPPKPPEPDQEASSAPLFSGLPEWLRDEDEVDQAATPSWLSPAPDASEGGGTAPEWGTVSDPTSVTRLDASAPAETSSPSWLQSLRESVVPPETVESDDIFPEPEPFAFAGIADAGAGVSDAGSQPRSPADSSEADVPPWLVDERLEHLSDESPVQSADVNAGSAPPSWPGVDVDESGEPVDLPAWLRELPVAGEAELAPLPAEPPQPQYGRLAGSPAPAAPVPTGDLPDWLRDIAAAPPAPPQTAAPSEPPAPPAPAAPAPTGDLPDWLRDIAAAPPQPPAPPQTAAPPEPPAPPAPAAPASTGDLPDWLRDIAAAPPAPSEPPAPPAPAAPASTGDLPDWLRDIAAAPPASAAPAPTGDLPDWLRDIAAAPPAPPATPVAPVAETASSASDLPDWLRDIAAAPSAPPAPAAPAPAGDLPDWLRDIAAAPPAPPAPPAPAAPAPASDLPDWLRDIAAAPPAPPAAPAAGTLPPSSDLPDWLRDIAAAPSAPPAPPAPPAPAAPAPTGDLPDWLEDEHGQPMPAGPPGDAGLPDWLRGADVAAPDMRDGQAQTAKAPTPSSDLLSGMDLPEWLRVEPEPKPETAPVGARDLDWLTRLGGVAEDEAGVGTPMTAPKLTPPPAPQRSEEQIKALSLLSRLAAEPIPPAAPLPAAEQGSALQRIGVDRLLSIILLTLVIIAVMFPGIAPFLATPPVVSAVSEAYEQITSLGANDVVLIGYEWDARRVGELRPLEQAVIGQLIAQDVKLVLVSTDPQGTLLQFDLLDTLRNAGYRQQGEGYLLLGYKPGGEIALRALGRDFQTVLRSDYRGDDATGSALIAGIDTGRPIARLNDLSLILVLADDTPDVQGWMEQVYPQAQTGDRPVSLVFLLPEETAPIVQPYMRQPGVAAVAGQRGALAYAALRQGSGAAEAGVADVATQQRLTILLFVVVLIFGLAISGIDVVRRRRL